MKQTSSSRQAPPPPPNYTWASYVEDRKPQYKYHRGRGQATNAIMYTNWGPPRGGTIYKLVDGEWIVFDEFHPDLTCVHCGKQLKPHLANTVDYYAPKREWKYRCRLEQYCNPNNEDI